jgi:hypothetical protein
MHSKPKSPCFLIPDPAEMFAFPSTLYQKLQYIERAIEIAVKYTEPFDVESPVDTLVATDDFGSFGSHQWRQEYPDCTLESGPVPPYREETAPSHVCHTLSARTRIPGQCHLVQRIIDKLNVIEMKQLIHLGTFIGAPTCNDAKLSGFVVSF